VAAAATPPVHRPAGRARLTRSCAHPRFSAIRGGSRPDNPARNDSAQARNGSAQARNDSAQAQNDAAQAPDDSAQALSDGRSAANGTRSALRDATWARGDVRPTRIAGVGAGGYNLLMLSTV
jgi:hypothetical protein